MAIDVIHGKENNSVVAGSLGDHQWIIGTTPVSEMLRVDNSTNRAMLVGVKYSRHRPTDEPKGDVKPDVFTRVTMLVDGGPWEQRMWNPDEGLDVTYRLNAPGDYIAWQPGPFHRWNPIGNATMISVSYIRLPPRGAEPSDPTAATEGAFNGHSWSPKQ